MSANRCQTRLLGAAVALALMSGPLEIVAQRPSWLGFRGNMGTEIPRGDPDEVFKGNIRGEFSVLFTPAWAYPGHAGIGFSWVSYPIEDDFPDAEQWNHVGLQAFVGLTLKEWIPLPVYIEARLIERRLRPLEERYWDIDADDPRRDTPYKQYHGLSAEGLIGLELRLGHTVSLDLAGRAGGFAPHVVGEPSLVPIRGGWTFGTQLGLIWFP